MESGRVLIDLAAKLHVSALDNGHLQVVQLHKTYMGCLYVVGRG